MKIDFDLIVSETKKLGLDIVSYSSSDPLLSDRSRLGVWQDKGYAADLHYMMRDPDLLSAPLRLLEEARSIVVFALYYDRRGLPPFEPGCGRVARYAWGRDYHKVIKKRLEALMARLQTVVGPSFKYRIFTDAVPLLERALARRAGLGFVGKNSMLIRPKSGSYFFLAEVLTNLEFSKKLNVVNGDCGSCRSCADSCPTGAIVSDRVIDAERCISYLTIEKRGMLSISEREAIGEWIFGCDICQEVCPFNHQSLKREEPPALDEFMAERGPGPLLNLNEILKLRTHEEFVQRFGGTALMRAGREGLLRNAAAVAANTSAAAVFPALEDALFSDASPVIRAHALWAMLRMDREAASAKPSTRRRIIDRANSDCAMVKDELELAGA